MITVLFLQACNLTKIVPKDQHLLQNNHVKGLRYSSTNSELLAQVKLRPNRKIFFLKAHLWAYKIGSQVKLDKIGEKPVLIDTALIAKSASNMERYLFKKGYFNNNVEYSISQGWLAKGLKQRKLKVLYTVKEGVPYILDSISYLSDNEEIKRILKQSREKSFLKKGNNVNYSLIASERSRISNLMKNNGYYFFNPSYLDFVIDSARGNHTANVTIQILEPQRGKHIKQRIESVTVAFYSDEKSANPIIDKQSKIRFDLNGMDIKVDVLVKNILLRPGDQFSQQKVQSTYGRLVALDLFESLGILNTVHEGDSSKLDVLIQLNPAPKFDFTWQPQVITTEQRFNQSQSNRNYGLANELSFKNKNVFHNGEEWSVNLRTALETQFTKDSNSIFSTFIQELNTDLKIPQLLFLNSFAKSPNIKSANTHISASYLYENNPFYRRNLFPLSYAYQIDLKKSKIFITPVLISLNKARYKQSLIDQASISYIQTLDRLFTNNLITSSKISGIFTNKSTSPKQYVVVNTNLLELAGLYLPQLTDYGKKFDVNHSTFIRSDVDVRYHYKLNENHELVLRASGGAGIPLGNRSVLPYERRFIAGGSNYMRGWRIRTIGPGSFTADNNLQFTRTGEVSMIGNFEYRFNVFRGGMDLNGALFGDIGNVWNLKSDTLFPGGEIKFDRFYHEFGINTGLGLRFDFDFLLLRLDWGVPVWDPNFPREDRLVIKGALKDKWLIQRPVWHVAVGYPF